MASRRRIAARPTFPKWALAGLCGLMLTASAAAAPRSEPMLATREGDAIRIRPVQATGLGASIEQDIATPLGSIWKLFVYSYLVARQIDAPDYQCRGQNRDEVYCCEPGGQIGREEALQRSCGLYFAPQRLRIKAGDWRDFWQSTGAADWLLDLGEMREARSVPVTSLLQALERIPDAAQREASQNLIGVLTRPNAKGLIADYGGRLRAKTWTMPDPLHAGMHIGGAAGWFANGQAFWLGGQGAGIEVLRQASAGLSPYLAQLKLPDDADCVAVRFFDRYPLRAVQRPPAHESVADGPLRGDFLALFAKGTELPFSANGELVLSHENGIPVVRGRLGLNDYVARVIEREGSAEPVAAAQALAVAARSYVAQQAERRAGCYQIRDSSATQRVGPRPPGRAARQIADWSSDLVLRGATVRYHSDKSAPGILSWQQARRQAEQGMRFDTILANAFPTASLGGIAAREQDDCIVAPQAQRWLAAQVPRWRPALQREAGYAEPEVIPAVCLTGAERPFADTERHRVHVRGWSNQQDHLALAHEYLHLAFEGHPRAQDENAVERLARRLILETH